MVRYEPRAAAYDFIEAGEKESYRARIRKTSRAFRDVSRRLREISVLKHPFLFCSVFFHKTSRHLTPFYMIALLLLNIWLLRYNGIYRVTFVIQALFYMLSIIGWAQEKKGRKFILFSAPYNFVLMNLGRLAGVVKSVSGEKVTSY